MSSRIRTSGLRLGAAAATLALLLGACSSSKPAGRTSTSTTAAASGSFCKALVGTLTALQAATSQSKLASVKRDFPRALAEAEHLKGAPSSLASDIPGLVSDLKAVNSWLQTRATQADLSSSTIPSAIAKPLKDLQVRGAAILGYAQKSCGYKATSSTPPTT